MPDENTNPVGTTQTSQNDQTVTNQSENDFVLDFGDMGDNKAPVTEEVQVDPSLSEEEKADNELDFDIDLGVDNQNSEDSENASVDAENSTASDISIDAPEEEKVKDFDISMGEAENEDEVPDKEESALENEEKVSDEEIIADDNEEISENEEVVPENEVGIPVDEETVQENDEIAPESEEIDSEDEENIGMDEDVVSDEEKVTDEEVTKSEEILADEEKVTSDEEIISDNEETVSEEEEISDEDIIPDEKLSFDFTSDAEGEAEESEVTNQDEERHLFKQPDEDSNEEISFDINIPSNSNETFQPDESVSDKTLFMGAEDTSTSESVEGNGEISFDLPQSSNNSEGFEFDVTPEEEKQPEIGDLLGDSPVDLSEDLNSAAESGDSSSFNVEIPVDEVEAGDEMNSEKTVSEPVPEMSFEPTVNETSSDVTPQEAEPESTATVDNNEFLLDVPQSESETQDMEQASQLETPENNLETTLQEQPQVDERSEMVNNAVPEMNENVAPEINLSTPVELSDVSSNQAESATAQPENQVKSTLSLDQILDTELSSNPQYSDNSKATPQNAPASGGKSKIGLLIGAGVAALACCVAVLAFPSITSERKSGDTVGTGVSSEYPTGDEEPFGSAPEEPTSWQNPITEEPEPTGNQQTYTPDVSDLPGVGGGGQVVILPDGEDDGGDDETGTEPVPYVWSGDGDIDDPEIETPLIDEVDANQILDVILSFKSQAEGYYSYAEQSSDNKLMKYSLRLINLSDNYIEKVNNGEGIDSESFSTFKSTANKIINKINAYLGGDDEEVQVIREATIGDESNFEGKDEIKDYIYNNR